MTTSIRPESPPPGAVRSSAIILAFPGRRKPEAPGPDQRLNRALEALNAAMAEQRSAVAAWGDVLRELKATTTSLDASLHCYRSNLRSLGSSLSSLHAKARALEQWADNQVGPHG